MPKSADLQTLKKILELDREWQRSAVAASSLARGQNDRWLAQFSPTRVAASRELREEAAAAYAESRHARGAAVEALTDELKSAPVEPRDLLAVARAGFAAPMVGLAVKMGAALPEETLRELRADALSRAAESRENAAAVPLVSQIGARSSAKGPRAEFAQFEHDLGGDSYFDTRHVYDPAHAARANVAYPSGMCVDEQAIRYARFRLPAGAAAKSKLPVAKGVGAARPEAAGRGGVHIVRAGGEASVFEPFALPRELHAYALCADPILRSHVDERWAEFARTRGEARASETAPLRALVASAEKSLAALAGRLHAGTYEEIEAGYLQDGWLSEAASAAYRTSAEAWTNPKAAAREQLLAELAQVAELTSGLRPLFAAHWRKNVSEEELLAQKPAERELFLKVRADNALSELAAELSSRRSDLLIFREPLALAASGAAID